MLARYNTYTKETYTKSVSIAMFNLKKDIYTHVRDFKLEPYVEQRMSPELIQLIFGNDLKGSREPKPAFQGGVGQMKSPENQLIDMIELWKTYPDKEATPQVWIELEELIKNMQLLVIEHNLQPLYNQHFPFAKIPDITSYDIIKAAIIPKSV